MTREEAIFCEKSYIGETNCVDCKYYGTDTCQSRESHRMAVKALEQEPRCKDCKWWKDSDGEYRRGCGAESHCPINRREVFEGNGYCYMFSPKGESEK